MKEQHYDVAIIGGGISGTALMYVLATYTNIKSIVLIEKYEGLSTLNSKASANSQTIHSGDIETNYTFQKAKRVKTSADMISKYANKFSYENKCVFAGQKMALGVGDEETEFIKNRYEEFKELYPYLEFFDKDKLATIEPKLVFDKYGKQRKENIAAMGVQKDKNIFTTVDYGALGNTFVENAKKTGKICDIYLNSEVEDINKIGDKFYIKTQNKLSISSDFVVVDAGGHSLYLAHKMGIGLEYCTMPVAGSFYMTKNKLLNGKVYMVQNPKLPFAALHGDPDLLANGNTRFGPTALVLPKLERYHGHLKSMYEFSKTLHCDMNLIKSIWDLLKDGEIRSYVLKNYLYEVPYFDKRFFLKAAQKIVPSLELKDIEYAKNFGGVRPQLLNKTTQTLEFGEGQISTDKGIIFNMTPSPGATSCLANARNDAKKLCSYLGFKFDENKFNKDLID